MKPKELERPKQQLEKRREAFNRMSGKQRWYDIKNQDGNVAEIRIYDEISWWGMTAEDFVQELDAITAPEILVMINSPGGEVFDGIAIYNALRSHPAKITTRVDALAASIASVIAQAGDRRIMLPGSQMMIHDAWGLAIGNAGDMREMGDLLDRLSDNTAGIYAAHANGDKDHFRALMLEDTWFSAEEAVAEGLADEVVEPTKSNEPVAVLRPAKRTLNDEVDEATDVVSETIKSVARVAALRAENGKELSHVNRDSLDGLKQVMEQLQGLLDTPTDPEESDDVVADAEREFARFVESSVAP